MKKIGLYIHIPYCKQKCIYCAFSSFCGKDSTMKKYFEKLKEEILCHKTELDGKIISSIFIGGGTPSFVDAKHIEDVLFFVKNEFNVQKNAEISIECNPDSVSLEKAEIWRNCGINRVSVGLQSIQDETLKLLNRPHNFSDYKRAINVLKQAGFSNINTDILIGLPNQTEGDIKKTVKALSDEGLTHISAYGLMVEDGTPLKKMIDSGKIKTISEEMAVALYNLTYNELKKYGYNRYEISNFCKLGFECKHNLNYWNRGEFLGVGLSAYSFLNGTHFENTKVLTDYLNLPYKKLNEEKETLKTAKEEFIMLSLRLEKGLDIKKFNKTFNADFEKDYQKQIAKLQKIGLIKIENNHVIITNFEVSNMIISEFF